MQTAGNQNPVRADLVSARIFFAPTPGPAKRLRVFEPAAESKWSVLRINLIFRRMRFIRVRISEFGD